MNSVLYSMIEAMTLRMTVMTAFVLLIKIFFKNKLSAKMHCMIWLILLIQLLFCAGNIRIQTPTSIYNVLPEYSVTVSTAPPVQVKTDIRNMITLIWGTGAAVFSLWHISIYAIYKKAMRRLPCITDDSTLSSLKAAQNLTELDSRRSVILKRGASAQTLSNMIILPEGFNDKEERQILLHELCHFRYYDNLKVWIALMVLCLNWYNPLIWLAFRRFRTDIEMLCDERVLKLSGGKRQEYAYMLIHSATGKNRFIPGTVSVHNGKKEVKARIKRIGRFRKMKPFWGVAATCACVTISCLCLTDAVTVAVENTVAEETQIDLTTTPEPIAPAELFPLTEPLAKEEPNVPETPQSEPRRNTPSDSSRSSRTDNQANPTNENTAQIRNSAPTAYTPTEPNTSNTEEQPPIEAESAFDLENKVDTSAVSAAANEAVASDTVMDSEIGNRRSSVYSSAGDPHEISSNGSRETYNLDNGSTAVLQYNGDTLKNGYIVDGGLDE